MAFLYTHPRYRDVLQRHELATAADFLRLSGVIYCGHHDRNVSHVQLGNDVAAYLKKEHRVRWGDRLANTWAGFGLVSKCLREMRLLEQLAAAGIGCPQVLAAGESDRQAFLLVGEVPGAIELRRLLQLQTLNDPERRRRLAEDLGRALAQVHGAGFFHGDLFAKHVLVREQDDGFRFWFLDWQRGVRATPSRARCVRDLAALHATLSDEVADRRERLHFLRSYAGNSGSSGRDLIWQIEKRAIALHGQRKVRELHQAPLQPGTQNLIWLDGEALCITRQFQEQLGGIIPSFLRLKDSRFPARAQATLMEVPNLGTVRLVRRRASAFQARLVEILGRRRHLSPELEQAGILFRLQRFGLRTPELLAVGQRWVRPWRNESFVLTRPIPGIVPLRQWLALTGPCQRSAEMLRSAGRLLRQVHLAGYCLGSTPERMLGAEENGNELVLDPRDGLQRMRRLCRPRILRDLNSLATAFSFTSSQTLRVLLGYFGRKRLDQEVRTWFVKIAVKSPARPSQSEADAGHEVQRSVARRCRERQVCS